MAKKVSILVNDDLDGSPNAATVTFGFDGATYEIDLSKKNRAKLEKAVAPYIQAGRRVSRSRGRTSLSRQAGPRFDRTAVRAWAKENGLTVSERGRIRADVLQQYEAAH